MRELFEIAVIMVVVVGGGIMLADHAIPVALHFIEGLF